MRDSGLGFGAQSSELAVETAGRIEWGVAAGGLNVRQVRDLGTWSHDVRFLGVSLITTLIRLPEHYTWPRGPCMYMYIFLYGLELPLSPLPSLGSLPPLPLTRPPPWCGVVGG